MKSEIILSNPERTVGFLRVEEFKGVKTCIDLEYLKKAIENLEDFSKKGLAPEKIVLGIETVNGELPGMVIFFLNEKETCGIAIAPILDKEGKGVYNED